MHVLCANIGLTGPSEWGFHNSQQLTWNCLHYLFSHYLALIVRELQPSPHTCRLGLRLWYPHFLPLVQQLMQNISLFSVSSWGGCSGYEQHSQQCEYHGHFSWHVWKSTRKVNLIFFFKVTIGKTKNSVLPAVCVCWWNCKVSAQLYVAVWYFRCTWSTFIPHIQF